MKKILLFFALFIGLKASAQFPNLDSLRKFNNKFIDNNSNNAFTNKRLNTVLNGLINFLDSALNVSAALKVDSVVISQDTILINYRGGSVISRDTIRVLGGGSGSPNTSVGSAFKIAINGTNNVKSIRVGQFILADSLTSGEIRLRVDTAGLFTLVRAMPVNIIANSPFVVLPGAGSNPDTLTCPTCGSYTGGPIGWVANIDSVKAYKPNNGTIFHTWEFNTGSGTNSGAYYQWNSSSTATADNHTIFQATAGGTGRWFIMPENGNLRLTQLGYFPNGTTAVNLQGAIDYSGSSGVAVHFPIGTTYYVDCGAGAIGAGTYAITAVNNATLIFDDSTAVIKRSVGSGHNTSIIGYYSTSIPLLNFTVKGTGTKGGKMDGGQTFIRGSFAGGNAIPDSNSHFISINKGKNIVIENMIFTGGATYSVADLVNDTNVYFRNNYCYYIGAHVVSTAYSSANSYIYITGNETHYTGMRKRWNAGKSAWQNMENVFEIGGSNNYVNSNKSYNETRSRGFLIETRLSGYNEYKNNYSNGNGMNTFGVSYGNDINTPTVYNYNNVISGNVQENMAYDVHTAYDTTSGVADFFSGSNLLEIAGTKGLRVTDNNWNCVHVTAARNNDNLHLKNTIYNPASDGATESGTAIIYNFGTAQTGKGQITNTVIEDQITMHNGQLFRATSNGDTIAGVNFKVTVKWDGDINYGELYAAAGGVNPTGISYNGSTFTGSAYRAFYTGTSTPINFDFSNVNAKNTNTDSVSNFVQVLSGVAPIVNKENTTFASGVYTTHVKTVNNVAPDATGNVNTSGGSAPIAGIQTSVTNTNQVNADFRMNSYLSNYNWLSNSAQRGMNLTTAPNTTITYASGHMRLVGGNATDVISDSVSSSLERWQENVLGQVQSTGSSDYFAFGIYYQGIQEIYFKVKNSDLSSTITYHNNDSTIATIAGQGSSSVGDSVLYSIKKDNFSFVFTVTNKTKGTTASANFSFPKIDVSTNIAPFRVFNMTLNPVAGTFDVVRWQLINQERRHPDIMLAGHSIMAGYNSGAPDSTIYNRLQNLSPDKRYSLYGIAGAVVNDFLSGVKLSDLLATRPERIIWMLGVNEIQTSVSLPTFISNYKKLIDSCEKYGIQTMITNCTPFTATYKNNIIAYNNSLDSAFPGRVIHIWEVMQSNGLMINSNDSLHPNATGSRLVAAVIDSAINAEWNLADNPRAIPKQFPDGTIQAYRKPGSQSTFGYIPVEIGSQNTGSPEICYNCQFDTTANVKYKQTDVIASIKLGASNGGFEIITAPSGTAGTAATLTKQWYIANDGKLGYRKSTNQFNNIIQLQFNENGNTDFSTGRVITLDGTVGQNNKFFGIGMGYLNSNTHSPGWFGYKTTLATAYTTGDFIWALRSAANETGDNAPTEFMRLTYAGVLRLAAYTSVNTPTDTINYKPVVAKLSDGSLQVGNWLGASGASGTVTSFNKTDGFGITSSVANSTTTPNHTVAIDSAAVFQAYAGRVVLFTTNADYTVSLGVSRLCYLYSNSGSLRTITLPNPGSCTNREIIISIAGTSVNVSITSVSGTATFYNNTTSVGTSASTNINGIVYSFKSDGTNWIYTIIN